MREREEKINKSIGKIVVAVMDVSREHQISLEGSFEADRCFLSVEPVRQKIISGKMVGLLMGL